MASSKNKKKPAKKAKKEGKRLVLTAKLKLETTPALSARLLATLARCNQASDYISQIAWSKRIFRQFDLHHQVYAEVREKFELSAQATVRCISKVTDAYKLDRKTMRTFRADGAIAYDSRLMSFSKQEQTVSIWTLEGRVRVPWIGGPRQAQLMLHQAGEADLCLVDGTFYLLASCKIKPQKPIAAKGVLGVDMGIENLATDSDGRLHGTHVRQTRRKRQKTRQSLQQKNSKSSKRKLKKRRRKERRFVQDVNHCISKTLVESAKRTNRGIALEDLKGIRKRVRACRQLRRELHSWAFYDLKFQYAQIFEKKR
jgi:putative transposase